MFKFSLQRVLASIAIIALGCSVLVAAHNKHLVSNDARVFAATQIALFYASAALFGTGIGNFFAQPMPGAMLGLLIMLIARFAF